MSGVQLVRSPRVDEEVVTVTLLSSESSKKGEYGTAEPVAEAVELYDVKRAHLGHLRWLFCCGWRKQHS